MIQMIEMKCPSCGANLSVEKEREMMYCDYCGAKIMLCNDHEYIYRRIDEAKVKKAETDRMVRMRELDLEMERQQQEKRNLRIKYIVSLVLGISGGVLFVIGIIIDSLTKNDPSIFFCLGAVLWMVIAYIWLLSLK